MSLPLSGMTVLDFSQFLAGPLAALRLADLGARVIKIERPQGGDLCRRLYITDVEIDGDSTPFHVINRNKQSYAADLKQPDDLAKVMRLIEQADVMIENFRPGVMQRIGLDYEAVRKINPRLVYGRITGYGDAGPWAALPGQDLLAQARSGSLWLSGNAEDPPTPYGLAIADMFAGNLLAEGVLASMVRQARTNEGALVETSLLEAMLDLQFEVLPTHLADARKPPRRSAVNNAHAYIAAPYGVYRTADGYLALAMGVIDQLGTLLEIETLQDPRINTQAFSKRDQIKRLIADRLVARSTQQWLDILQPADIWCAEVMTWGQLLAHDAFKVLDMIQTVSRSNGVKIKTLRSPIRIDGDSAQSTVASPCLGEHTKTIDEEFGLCESAQHSN